jgi:hypothetical protein
MTNKIKKKFKNKVKDIKISIEDTDDVTNLRFKSLVIDYIFEDNSRFSCITLNGDIEFASRYNYYLPCGLNTREFYLHHDWDEKMSGIVVDFADSYDMDFINLQQITEILGEFEVTDKMKRNLRKK